MHLHNTMNTLVFTLQQVYDVTAKRESTWTSDLCIHYSSGLF